MAVAVESHFCCRFLTHQSRLHIFGARNLMPGTVIYNRNQLAQTRQNGTSRYERTIRPGVQSVAQNQKTWFKKDLSNLHGPRDSSAAKDCGQPCTSP